MKKIGISYIVLLISISYNIIYSQDINESKTIIQRNIAVDNVLLKVFETCDIALLDDIISPEFINHTATRDCIGIENHKTMVQRFHTTFKPQKVEVLRRLSDNEYVSDWVKFINPTSVIEGIEMTKYQNGKAVEHWFFPNSKR